MTNRLSTLIGMIFALVLMYPAWQAGKWAADHLWAAYEHAVATQAKQITLVVGPMLPISIDGKAAHALGTDTCPGQPSDNLRWLFGESSSAGMRRCIVVTPATTKVRVSLIVNAALGPTQEWTVDRSADKLSFLRPDGSPVIVAETLAVH